MKKKLIYRILMVISQGILTARATSINDDLNKKNDKLERRKEIDVMNLLINKYSI